MAAASSPDRPPLRPLRLWPGAALVALQWLLWLSVPLVNPDARFVGAISGVLGGLAILLWWLLFSRAPWLDRIGAVAILAGALAATYRLADQSISTGMMGMLLVVYGVPALSLALVVWAAATRGLSSARRRLWLVIVALAACGVFVAIRTEGVAGDSESDFRWRWTPSAEERLLARAVDEPAAREASPPVSAPATGEPASHPPGQPQTGRQDVPAVAVRPGPPAAAGPGPEPSATAPSAAAVTSSAEWPGFRGPDRDGIARSGRIDTDWSRFPPVRMWKRPVGPGWSSFAVRGDLFYTQEQRGGDEIVACYRVSTGEPVWRHRDATRFWESNSGAGPRATPTLDGGRLYSLGATGRLNALDASSGALFWSRDVASDTGTAVPTWGFAGSPLVVDDLVVTAAAGRLAAYDAATGERRWLGPARGGSYSSPHRATVGGVPQVLLISNSGIAGVAPADGSVLWEYAWEGEAIVQPAVTPDGDLLVSTASAPTGQGIRRLAVSASPGGWSTEVRWRSNGLKPYFNDLVVHEGHVYGFDGAILACIDLAGGTRAWKGGRYGYGQMLLLAEQDVLLVLSEDGELALVEAKPGQYRELARVPAIEGKTWNHPVLAGDVLLVRNGEEMAAFRLPLADPRPSGPR